jgi:hypothetical protein
MLLCARLILVNTAALGSDLAAPGTVGMMMPAATA